VEGLSIEGRRQLMQEAMAETLEKPQEITTEIRSVIEVFAEELRGVHTIDPEVANFIFRVYRVQGTAQEVQKEYEEEIDNENIEVINAEG